MVRGDFLQSWRKWRREIERGRSTDIGTKDIKRERKKKGKEEKREEKKIEKKKEEERKQGELVFLLFFLILQVISKIREVNPGSSQFCQGV